MAKKIKKKVSSEELSIAFEGPAVAASRVFVSLVGSGVRLSFVEEHPEAPMRFRSAVVLPIQSAISLKDILGGMLSDIEGQIADAEEAAKEDQEDNG